MLEPRIDQLMADPAFLDWFSGSACVHPDGRPRLLYHGTDAEPFQVFLHTNDFGFHFGDLETAQTRLDQMSLDSIEGHQVIPVVARVRAPLRLSDHHTWQPRNVLGELLDLGIVSPGESEWLAARTDWDETIPAAIERAGYDCVVYANDTEQGGDSWLIWNPRRIKSVFSGEWDKADPRLNPSAPVEAHHIGPLETPKGLFNLGNLSDREADAISDLSTRLLRIKALSNQVNLTFLAWREMCAAGQ
ncbi:hypothetical protein CKO28_01015 [Rhodovibrio sodomensis]|uniref:Uncharacterized protein n=1 Tax=Rhodovibrio sodomensis TaxID=1088 RepID=A0ABS1DA55_9PROT|nr:hypothetical protein [Rhodovibrio sodomensis]MBK1666623.1 hypothetical protein [Rhodovibrio sodomensis]